MLHLHGTLQEIRKSQEEEFFKDREEAEMEMSDSEDGEGPVLKKRKDSNFPGQSLLFVLWTHVVKIIFHKIK